jgi:hypothetical protein
MQNASLLMILSIAHVRGLLWRGIGGEYAASGAGAVFVQGAGKQNSRSFDFVRYANFAQKDSLYFLSRTLALFPASLRVCF